MYTFIQQGCIKLFKSDSKDIYVRKDLNQKNAVFNKTKLLKLFLLSTNSSILEWFLKDHVTLKTRVMNAENSALP